MTPASSWSDMLLRGIDKTPTPTAVMRKNMIIYGNDAFRQLCGDVVGQSADSLFNEENADFFRWLTREGKRESDQTVLTMTVGKAAEREVLVQVWPVDEEVGLLSIKLDYSLQRIADLDELTRLPNRRKANWLLEMERTRQNRFSGFCLAIGDIDKFKNVNDTYGHQVGDDVLRHVAKILQKGVRESDWVARWGGEEFLVFVTGGDLATGMRPMNRIHRLLNETPFAGPPSFPVTMSFGIVSSGTGTDMEALIQKADSLMYDAKNAGRNRVMWKRDNIKIWFIGSIRKAIDDGKIIPAYAPVVDWKKQVVAVDIRCGVRGESGEEAARMLKIAEQLNLRADIDMTLLKKTAAELPAKSSAPFFFPVNNELLSGQQKKTLMSLFKKFPHLCAGMSCDSPLSEESLQTLTKGKVRLALVDFSPANAPLDLLATGMVSYIILSPADAAVLPLIPPNIACFAAGGSAAAAKRGKFAGLLHLRRRGKLSDITLSDAP